MKSLPIGFNVLFLIFSISFSTYAQVETYDLSKYARPEIHRKTLRFSTGAQLFNLVSSNDLLTDKNNGLGIDLFIQGSQFNNTIANQNSTFTSATVNFDYNSKTDNINEKNIDLRFNLSHNTTNRKFYQEKRFIEIGGTLSGAFILDVLRVGGEEIRKNGRSNGFVEVPILHGHGRIELVNDAWRAVTMIQMLEREGFLQKGFSHEEITEFADTIAVSRNKRLTDPRHEIIYELEALSQFLVQKKFVAQEDFRFFAHMHDIYSFENFFPRQSGRTIKYGLEPRVSLTEIELSTIDDFYNVATGLFFVAEYEKLKPLDVNWQFDHGVEVGIGQSVNRSIGQDLSESQTLTAFVGGQLRYGYYPNVRTNFDLRIFGNYSYVKNNVRGFNQSSSSKGLSLSIQPQFQYYVSPRLTWTLGGNFAYTQFNPNNQIGNQSFNNRINFTSTYFIY